MPPSSSDNVPRPCACTTVRTASRLLARAYDSALQGVGLNVTQLATLRSIDRLSGKPLSQVADALSMDRTSVYRSVSTMERQGWVSVHDGPDGRSRSVTVEKPGRELLDRASQPWSSMQSAVVTQFGRRRWRALVAELQALSEVVDAVDTERLTKASPKKSR